jgi:hypothetical protein
LVSLFEDDRPDFGVLEGNGTEDSTFRIIEFAEAIRDYLNGLGYNAQRIYSRSGNYAQGPERYENGTSLPDELTLNGNPAAGIPAFPWTGGAADIRAAIDAGNFIVTYDGHGGRTNWSRPAFNTGDVANLNNGNLTPVVFSFACQCGWFDNETDHADLGTGLNDESLCEHLLRRANGGAVAVVGATRNSWDNNDFMMLGVYKAIWPDFAPNPPSSRAVPQMQIVPLARMGQIHTFCKVFMANAYGHDFNRQSSFEMYHLFGDPEMPVWTRAPGELEVKHPSGVGATGAQDLVVKVTDKATHNPVQSAVVTLTRTSTISGGPVDRIIQTQQTDPAGVARFALYSVGDGDIDVTVTALNYRPYMGVMTVVSGGAQLTVDPDDGVEGQNIHVIGQGFSGNENVDIYFDGQWMLTTAAQGGDFGQAPSYVDIQVPSPHAHERVNVTAVGQTSGRCAVDVFQVRDANPVDLWTYSQWDNTTWGGAAGPTWNSPDIQLYDRGGQPVASNNLTVGESYTVKAEVHNNSAFQAQQARIVFRWANYGVGGPWNEFHTDTQDVPTAGATAEAPFTPGATGHLCLRVEIFHAEDITPDNNQGQENLHVGPTSSPTEVCFLVWNLTKEPAAVFLEVRQLPRPSEEPEEERLWGTWVVHPDPQVLEPGDRAEACVVVDPDLADARPGTTAEFAVTGYINGTMIGGVNLLMTKK